MSEKESIFSLFVEVISLQLADDSLSGASTHLLL